MHSPFKFLDAYTREDRKIFFGRDREIEELYQKVFESRILVVYGISGTGKTSLINCGLANKFEESDWLPVSIRRGRDINESLESEIHRASITGLNEGASIQKAIQSVYLDHFKPIYLIFDQFEELFIFGDRTERETFIQTISELVNSESQCKCLFSIREEYLAGVTEFESTIPEFLSNRMRVEKMTHKNATEVIEGPCQVNGIAVEAGFAEALLHKLNPDTNEIELTWLQVFLDKIFKLSGEKNEFTLAQIKQAGDVSDLLGSFLEEQIAELEDPDRGLVVLKAFVSIQGTKKLIGEQEISDFAFTLGNPVEKEKLTDLLQRFVNLRVLKEKDEHNQYELRHDSLAVKIYEKITLIEKELLEIKEFLDNAFNNFERRGITLNEPDLQYIAPYEDKLFLSKRLHQFIANSKNEIQKVQRRRRRLVFSMAAVLIAILTFFTAWALQERGKAVDQTRIAEEKRTEAITARDQAILAQEEADRSRGEAEVSSEEALAQKQLADSALLVAEYQRSQSEEQRLRAERLFEEARTQSQIAREAQQDAETSSMEVQETSRKAMFQLYLFNAQEFASKSLLIENDDTLAAILALNAFDLVDYGYGNYSDSPANVTYDIQLYEAIQKAWIGLEDGTLYTGDHWALDLKQEIMAISNEKNQVLFSSFEEPDKGSFPKLIEKSSRDLNQRFDESSDGSLITLEDDSFIRFLCIDDENQRLVAANSRGVVSLTDITGIGTSELYSHQGNISTITVSPLHHKIISTARDQSLIVYDIEEKKLTSQHTLDFKTNDLPLLQDRYVVFHDQGRAFYRLDILDKEADAEVIFGINRTVEALDICNIRNRAAIVSPGLLTMIDLNDEGSGIMKRKEWPIPHTGMISDIIFSPNGKWLVISGFDGVISLWDISSPDLFEKEYLVPIIHFPGVRIRQVMFDQDSKYLIYSDMKRVFIYPVDMHNTLEKLSHKLDGRRLSDIQWSNYVKGDLERPDRE